MEYSIARLESHTEQILRDVQDMRQDVKRIREKVEPKRDSFDEVMKVLGVSMWLGMSILILALLHGFKWI